MYMKVLVLGDSHARCFTGKIKSNIESIDVVSIPGASAQGLTNENSKFQALNKFRTHLSKNIDYDCVYLFFGEIDCNMTIWSYSQKYNISLKEQFSRSVNNYKTFIKKEINPYFSNKQINLLGPILPTIKTNMIKFQNTNRKNITVTQSSRTRLTNIFSQYIEKFGYKFYSINHLLLNHHTKLFDDKYEINNHHLDNRIAKKLWLSVLPI